jgi:hypothetical protein
LNVSIVKTLPGRCWKVLILKKGAFLGRSLHEVGMNLGLGIKAVDWSI